MRGGFSGCTGIMLYDTDKSGKNAVYGYFDEENLVIRAGTFEEIDKFRKNKEDEFKREDKPSNKVMLKLFLVILALIVGSFFVLPFFKALVITLILIASYIPILGICFTNINMYATEELRQQFKRYHGCEHKAIRVLTKDKEINYDNLKNMSIYDPECGSVYMGYILTILAVLIVLCLNFAAVGLIKSIIIVVASVILLFINISNPYNPYKLLQKNVVAEPTDREYAMALLLLKKLKEL